MEQNNYSGPLGSTGINLKILHGGPGLGDTTVASSHGRRRSDAEHPVNRVLCALLAVFDRQQRA